MKTALTIAGSDSSGGAGIQADLKTFLANGVYGMSAITALTAQNTCGVRSVLNSTPEFLCDQLDAIFEDIFPDAVKIGMVSSAKLIEIIAAKLKFYGAKNIVVDPVMVATSGAKLIDDDAINTLKAKLFPLAKILTPNLPELETITAENDAEIGAKKIFEQYGCAVLAKGGHGHNDANDFFYDGAGKWFFGRKIDTLNTHGTGCTLSSAIAANLAKGYDLKTSVGRAKSYLTGALSTNLNLGKGSGPLDHGFNLRDADFND
ncbi:MAG: bifunctional hydroxymethylpyrimidine kinase/phosphomethylpyrimidine kinase [Quinella sp. 3Q1]|nr:bifunctional hydroxymethylpyrimidine kinase/phosphomethylpyrimidine kinase [Quinella sp. 3Q1]MBR3049996.1 bifunctional hydroxymethylpyrimidine kinase/phosphomethylpyrimidine kinase [Selenomonadaceae bacterium]MBR6888878.1 bifunctional hydroxymethylpyrimidine kinase/phosphomethylpyrimidine kinase [Selenomonadaceae bacterium]